MSNLLVGIIAVALFIGIAISGAIMLGSDFDDAANSATAVSALRAVTSVAESAGSFRYATGYARGVDLDSPAKLVSAGFMRMVPVNPTGVSNPVTIVDAAGVDYASSAAPAGFSPRYVVMSVGADSAMCAAVETLTGNVIDANTYSSRAISAVSFDAGCYRSSAATAATIAAGDYVVYARI